MFAAREHFKFLHVGILSGIKRKTLPAIAKAAGDSDPQALHHAGGQGSVERRRAAHETTDPVRPSARR
jgi:SRSO17 transposase